ncbi:hypothetical protein PG987_010160 [Apiospora arundinis]
MANLLSTVFSSPTLVFTAAFLLRAVLLVYGLWQDANSPLKYTDIDYLVFTDAARFTFSSSPQPLQPGNLPLHAATRVPALAHDPGRRRVAARPAGAMGLMGQDPIRRGGPRRGLSASRDPPKAPRSFGPPGLRYAGAIWLLNPMVAAISTRGSSEGLLGVLVAALLWAVLERRVVLAGLLLGLGVHFKIYPFIYAPAIVWWMDAERMSLGQSATTRSSSKKTNNNGNDPSLAEKLLRFVTPERVVLTLVSLATFAALNLAMYALYGHDFLQHTFLHHVTRIDHRHNFSPYNVLLYLASAAQGSGGFKIESVAFVPQLLLSVVLIPLVGAKKDLAATMLAQTFAFVTFNKVCTSQVSLLPLVHGLPPLYLPDSSLTRRPRLGLAALALWVAAQGAWLQQGFNLEFLGRSTFAPGLWWASLAFFLVNCWILGLIISDLGTTTTATTTTTTTSSRSGTSKVGGGATTAEGAVAQSSSSTSGSSISDTKRKHG